MRQIMSEFLEIGEKSYYVWKNKSHKKLIKFIETYFSEEELREWLDTGRIERIEKQNKIEEDILEQHILFNTIKKINDIPNMSLLKIVNLGKKEFWLGGLIKALEVDSSTSKDSLIISIKGTKTNFFENEHWKVLTVQWIEDNLSQLECQLLCKNKNYVIGKIKQ